MSDAARVVVVGAGPGGIAAAAVAAESGCRVVLLDENPSPGGQIWRSASFVVSGKVPHGKLYAKWLRRLQASGAEHWPSSTAVDRPAPNLLRVEREGRWRDLGFDRLILATGARERFLPFPGWTLPGVMGAGGLQALVKSGLPVAGSSVVVAGSGPLLIAVAAGIAGKGAKIQAIFEQADLRRLVPFGVTLAGQPGKLQEGAIYRLKTVASPYKLGWWVKSALGQTRLQAVVATNGSSEREIPCDLLACGFHLVPNLELPRLLGCRIEAGFAAVNAEQESSQPGVYCVGELTGVGGLDKALVEGQIAGLAAAGIAHQAASLLPMARRQHLFAQRLDAAFAPREELRTLATAETIICRCEDVTRDALKACQTGRAARLHTRCGMGPCQGRVCGPATEFLFSWSAASSRPPVFPARISTLAGDPDFATQPQPTAVEVIP
jgi:NADPH-dependent 2,4-dienoyl-CoA reductase/sulfur reductase-like enzyme